MHGIILQPILATWSAIVSYPQACCTPSAHLDEPHHCDELPTLVHSCPAVVQRLSGSIPAPRPTVLAPCCTGTPDYAALSPLGAALVSPVYRTLSDRMQACAAPEAIISGCY